jgi:prefoldin subunit 5
LEEFAMGDLKSATGGEDLQKISEAIESLETRIDALPESLQKEKLQAALDELRASAGQVHIENSVVD